MTAPRSGVGHRRRSQGSAAIVSSPAGGDLSVGDGGARPRVAGIQRSRILAAAFDVAYEHGMANVTVGRLVARGGVSRRTFYELFTDCEECLLAAFEDAIDQSCERVLPAYQAPSGWQTRIRAGLVALLCFLDEEAAIGRFLIFESLTGGPRIAERRAQVVARVVQAIGEGQGQGKTLAVPAPLAAEAVVGGVLSVLQNRLAEPDGRPLLDLASELMSMIVLPYLGATAARRELELPVQKPPVVEREPVLANDPFKAVGMRLTYRTVRVLSAITQHPGSSNRQVADLAEIGDQGQVSKLLARLERIGLIHNTSPGSRTGEPNAWSLTHEGRQVTTRITAHT